MFNPPVGRRPVLQNCVLAELDVDTAYQRTTDAKSSAALIKRIAKDWNWSLCQPLVVARRPDDRLYVVDGQHRLAAARMRGDIQDLPCVVCSYGEVADEAAHFVQLNQERRPLGALDLFKASLAGGDNGASGVMGLLADCGLTLAPHTNFTAWKPGMVSHVGGIQRAYARHGADLTARALRLLARSFEGKVLRYGGTLFGGIVSLLADLGAQVDEGVALAVLRSQDQAGWMKRVMAVQGEQGVHRSVAVGIAIREAYRKAASVRPNSLEAQLERVRNGAQLVPALHLRKPDPDMTLGGVGTGML